MDSWPLVVALTGAAGSGKSTAARYLIEHQGYTLVKLAAPLKGMLRALGLGDEHIEGALKEKPCPLLCGKTPRWAMQTLGTEWGRDLIGPDFWVSAWREIASDVLDHGGRVVVDDCRFVNEAAVVRALSGIVIELRGRTQAADNHVSEKQRPEPDVRIANLGTIEMLHEALAAVPVLAGEVTRVSGEPWRFKRIADT